MTTVLFIDPYVFTDMNNISMAIVMTILAIICFVLYYYLKKDETKGITPVAIAGGFFTVVALLAWIGWVFEKFSEKK